MTPAPTGVTFAASYATFVDAVASAELTVRVVGPGVDEPHALALAEAARRGVNVRVVVDPSEEMERHGFGTLRAVEHLLAAGVEVRQLPDNAVGLVLVDGLGYLHVARSRMFAADGAGLNAVRVDAVLAERLSRAFFPPRDDAERAAKAAATEGAEPNPLPVEPLDAERFDAAQASIRDNPPRDPDLTRQFSAYTTRLQFIDITLEGGTFDQRTVSLPAGLPIGVSQEFNERLKAQMRVFGRNDLPALKRFKAFCREVKSVRDEHSVHLPSRDKRIFRTEAKQRLKEEITALQAKIEPMVKDMAAEVEQEVRRIKAYVEKEITRMYVGENPDESGLFRNDPEALDSVARRKAQSVFAGIRFPDPNEILGRIGLRVHFYDMTWQDFDDEAFVQELHLLKVIDAQSANELRHLRAAFEAR